MIIYNRTDQSYDIPYIPFDMKATLHVERFWTWASDTDTGRMYFALRREDTSNFNQIDTGNVNWSSSGTSGTWDLDVTTEAKSVRFYGRCIRRQGSYCSAEITGGTFTLNANLPLREDYILIK